MSRPGRSGPMREKARVMESDDLRRALVRMAHEILERHKTPGRLVMVGIRTRGAHLAARLAAAIGAIESPHPPAVVLDVTRHRDDRPVSDQQPAPVARAVPQAGTESFPVEGRDIVLVDDVIYTGRTVRAAMDALIEMGRPATVQLAVLIDRGHRELPIRPDYVGKNVPTSGREHVAVRLAETDGRDEVVIEEPA